MLEVYLFFTPFFYLIAFIGLWKLYVDKCEDDPKDKFKEPEEKRKFDRRRKIAARLTTIFPLWPIILPLIGIYWGISQYIWSWKKASWCKSDKIQSKEKI